MLRSSHFYVFFPYISHWLVDVLINRWVGWLLHWLIEQLCNWLVEWLYRLNWLIDWSFAWLIDWLTDCVESCRVDVLWLYVCWFDFIGFNWLIYGSFDWLRSFVGADSCVTYLQRLPESHFGSRAWKCSKSASRGFLRANSGAGPRNAQNEPPEASWEPFREQSPEMLKMSLQRVPKSNFYGFWSLEVRFEQ